MDAVYEGDPSDPLARGLPRLGEPLPGVKVQAEGEVRGRHVFHPELVEGGLGGDLFIVPGEVPGLVAEDAEVGAADPRSR